MKNIFKPLLFVLSFIAFTTMSCQNASDDVDPNITDFRVDGVSSITEVGDHNAGSTINFEMNISDNKGLTDFFISTQEQGVVNTQSLEGSTAAVQYNFLVNNTYYSPGDTVQITFIAEDKFGNSGILPYSMRVR